MSINQMSKDRTGQESKKGINQDNPQEITNYVVQEYYKENLEPFFSILHPDILFLSVGSNQVVEGIDNLREAYQNGMQHGLENAVRYEILSFNSKKQRVTATIYNTLVQMKVLTYYPSGKTMTVNQRISVNWRKFASLKMAPKDIRSGWFAMQIHVSVGVEPQTPVSSLHHLAPSMEREQIQTEYRQEEKKYMIRDCDRYEHYVRAQQIVHIDAKDFRSYVYMQNGEILVTRKGLQEFEEELTGRGFVRIHKSHIVNKSFIKGISNYKLTLLDGTLFSVPRGKYKLVKESMLQSTKQSI